MSVRVESEGDLRRKILFIGEAPAAEEVRFGRPFVGRAGKEQDRLNTFARITRDDARWTNVMKIRAPSDKIDFYFDLSKKPSHETFLKWIEMGGDPPKGIHPDVREHVQELFEEVELSRANVIVPLGNIPLWTLTGLAQITKRRGSILMGRKRKVIPCVHPSAILRSGSVIERRLAILDLQRVFEEAKSPKIDLPQRDLIIYPTLEEALLYIEECRALEKIGFDIECMTTADGGKEMSCVGFATSAERSMCIPFISQGKNKWTEEEELELMLRIGELLEDEAVLKIGQNIIFDTSFMFRKYNIICKPVEDTMIAQAIRFPDFPKGLDFLTRYYTREPYYKDEGKEWKTTGGDREADFFRYNAKDAALVLEIFPQIVDKLKKQDREIQ